MGSATTVVIGFTGPIAAGKSTLAAAIAARSGFVYLRSSATLAKMLEDRGELVNEDTLQAIGKEVIDTIGGRGLSSLVLRDYDPNKNYVYDSIRHVADCSYFRERFGDRFHLVFVDAPGDVRMRRYSGRSGRETSEASYFRRLSHSIEEDVPNMVAEADVVITNEHLEDAIAQIDSLIQRWTSV